MKLKHGVQFILMSIVTFSRVASQNISDISSENSTDTSTTPEPENPPNLDYIVRLLFYVDEEKIPAYMIKMIYSNSSENNITVQDVFSLYGIDNVTLTQTGDILRHLHIQPSNVLSINGLESFLRELNIEFKLFYNQIFLTRLNVFGLPLKNFLIALDIDNSKFTEGMAYGEPEPYEVFRKGNFSETSMANALKIVNRTADELFVACRDEIFARAVSLDTKVATKILKTYNFGTTEALELWTYLNITTSQLQNIQVFNNTLDDLKNDQNTKEFLGVVTNESSIATHKIVYDTWKQKSFSKMYAELISRVEIQEIEEFSSHITDKIISLNLVESLNTSFSVLESTLDDMKHCIFVTSDNNTLSPEAVEEVMAHEEYIDVRLQSNRTSIVLGSPLICGGKVYGLAAELVDSNTVRFDSFYDRGSRSSAVGLMFNGFLLVISVLSCSR